jgi:uncharacterized paraquat-inducible protein A
MSSSGSPALPSSYRGCATCGLVHVLDPLAPGQRARCQRCHSVIARSEGARANASAASAALAALLLYPLAVSLPILRLERLGQTSESSVWAGSLGLLAHGEIAVGLVVFLCSVVLPLAKLIAILLLVGRGPRLGERRAWVWHAVELTGRWGMLDVLLVALLVSWLKLGSLVEVHPGPGAAAFTACVFCSLLAGAWFDPHALWEDERR